MDDAQFLSFVLWSTITGVVLLVTGVSYRAYAGRHRRSDSA